MFPKGEELTKSLLEMSPPCYNCRNYPLRQKTWGETTKLH